MRSMLNCRRGSAAFATVVAMIPLIAAISLGGEAGTWYVTRHHAQNAADAAAYSGALKLACDLAASSSVTCSDASTVDYRGKQFAARNAFCNSGDTSYPGSRCSTTLPTGTSQSVAIAQLTSWKGETGNFVQATVGQQQPAFLAKFLGLSTVSIQAMGTAKVVDVTTPCVLALKDSITFQGSTTVNSPKCGLASNSTSQNSVDFTGNGLNVTNVGSISGGGGCKDTGGAQCSKAITYAPPAPDPLSGLNAAISALKLADFTGGSCGSSLKAYGPANGTTAPCYNTTWPSGSATLSGVYFLTGNITINGSPTISGTATLILMPPKFLSSGDTGATLRITGNPTIQLTALSSVTTAQVPSAMSTVVGLMSKLLIYDPEASSNLKISGSSTSYFNGITYAPNADVTYQGSTQAYDCVQVIAKGVSLSGNSIFDNTGCPASSVAHSRYVRMVP
ncbi:pilus assembly protein TadG-related protein [Bradyrhizobium sp. USDA 3458]|uniref:pilus assembly protein TadG-related protein n=1 Tax=Bradyrhizobium sp. USDA 3458 TaxID=2591461 RepID=UPI00132FDF35|nr:pilus assembly protein TadG-related protein [Bradyrhizobium sp. USDA 3458]